jgi:FAS-associated factor 2
VQIAITKFFDGEGPDILAEAQAAHNDHPRAAARHENLQESFLVEGQQPRVARAPRTEPAPRVVPQAPTLYQPPIFLAIIFAPFRVGYTVFSGLCRFVLYIMSFLPQQLRSRAVTSTIRKGWRTSSERRALLPRETAERFRREFEEEYGSKGLSFFEGGHAQALDAAKKDPKFLLTVLVSPEHDDTDSFIRNTLLSPEVVAFVNDPANNIIVWGGNVLDSEPYQVASEYMCTKYPFSCLVCLTPKEGSARMGIVKRMTGPISPTAYVDGLQSAISKYAPDLEGVRAERTAQAVVRDLRSEQDSAYERSLARDRERARQRKEAEAAAAAAERRALEEAEAAERLEQTRQQWRKWRATTIAPEPDTGAKDAVRLALNIPSTGRIIRKFAGQTTLEELYAFVDCYDLLQAQVASEKITQPEGYEHKYAFRIASVLPRETLEPSLTITIWLWKKYLMTMRIAIRWISSQQSWRFSGSDKESP